MESIIEIIKKRYSVRYYTEKAIEKDKRHKIEEYLSSNIKGPLGSVLRFELIDASDYNHNELKEFGTYGMITGAKVFIAGAVKKGKYAMEDFGYCMEKNVLAATDFGLGTCWLGGSFNRSTFAKKLKVSESELIPAVSPLGYTGDKKTIKESVLRMVIGSKNRKKFDELFLKGNYETPLNSSECEEYSKALEAVRIAPSASNKQPWRIIKEEDKSIFHFYLKENTIYNNAIKGIKIQNIDIGIAMCHFELAAQELGLKGFWETNKPALSAGNLLYIASWVG